MIHRTQGLLLLLTAVISGIVTYILNDVGASFPLSDGGSHYVTGLLAYDWLHTWEFSNPLQYGTEYFKHFPYIGILLWPPLFYGLELVAFSLFGPSVDVALMLCTAIAVAGGVVLGRAALKSRQSGLVAHCMVVAILTSVLIQDLQRNVLVDGLVSVLSLAAIFQFAYFIVTPSWRGAAITGLLTILAFYAKGNGMQLGLAFPILAVLLRRPRMLIDRRTLVMGIGCILITGPWLYLTAGLSAQGFLHTLTLKDALELIGAHLHNVLTAAPVLIPFAILGAWKTVSSFIASKDLSEPRMVFDAACLSIVIACLLFHTLIPAAGEARYVLTAVFGCVGLAASGLEMLIGWFRKAPVGQAQVGKAANVSLLVAAVFAIQAVLGLTQPLPAYPTGVETVAQQVMKSIPGTNRSVLLSGDFNMETSVGPVLAGLDSARRATRDGIVLVRGSRVFAGGAYRNRDYIAKFANDAAYLEELQRLAIPVIVTSTPRPNEQWEHVAAIERVLAMKESNFVKVAAVSFTPTQQISVWRRKGEIKPIDFDVISESNSFRQRINSVVK